MLIYSAWQGLMLMYLQLSFVLFELRLHGPVKSISIMTRHLLARGKKIGLWQEEMALIKKKRLGCWVVRELFELRLHGPVKSISIMTRHLLARGKKIGLWQEEMALIKKKRLGCWVVSAPYFGSQGPRFESHWRVQFSSLLHSASFCA